MWIIYGTRGIESTIQAGEFHCPRCGPGRRFKRKSVRRWFTLYFLPVIPLYKAGDFVECFQCSGTFGPETLENDPSRKYGATDQIKRLLILASLASDASKESAAAAVRSAYFKLTNLPLTPEEFQREVKMAQRARTDLITFADKVETVFDDEIKPMLVVGAYVVLSSQYKGVERHELLLRQLGQTLQMPHSLIDATLDHLRKRPAGAK